MTDTNVKIRAKGCASTGITDELASKMYGNKGGRYMAIVEFKVDETHEKADGDRKVDLVIEEVEPVVDGNLNGALDEHVRTIQQALYRNRALAEGQSELDFEDGPEPSVADVIQAGKALVETDEQTGEATGLWDGNTDEPDDEEPAADEDNGFAEDEVEVDEDAAEATTRPLAGVPNPFTPQEA